MSATAEDARRAPLTRERVLGEAIALADSEGLEALSMRRLGRRLGVEAMSLYNHVANKDDLLDGIVEYVLAEMEVPSRSDDWEEAIRNRAMSARLVFTRHPWAMGLLEARYADSSPQRLHYYDAVLGNLRDAGFDVPTAIRGFSIIDSYIFGFILQEMSLGFDDADALEDVGTDLLRQMGEAYPHLTEATVYAMESGYDRETEFRFGLDIIVEGLKRIRDAGTDDAAPDADADDDPLPPAQGGA
jgi:AcrR family transcriptional regulator